MKKLVKDSLFIIMGGFLSLGWIAAFYLLGRLGLPTNMAANAAAIGILFPVMAYGIIIYQSLQRMKNGKFTGLG